MLGVTNVSSTTCFLCVRSLIVRHSYSGTGKLSNTFTAYMEVYTHTDTYIRIATTSTLCDTYSRNNDDYDNHCKYY